MMAAVQRQSHLIDMNDMDNKITTTTTELCSLSCLPSVTSEFDFIISNSLFSKQFPRS
jgi:hypothetical protein